MTDNWELTGRHLVSFSGQINRPLDVLSPPVKNYSMAKLTPGKYSEDIQITWDASDYYISGDRVNY